MAWRPNWRNQYMPALVSAGVVALVVVVWVAWRRYQQTDSDVLAELSLGRTLQPGRLAELRALAGGECARATRERAAAEAAWYADREGRGKVVPPPWGVIAPGYVRAARREERQACDLNRREQAAISAVERGEEPDTRKRVLGVHVGKGTPAIIGAAAGALWVVGVGLAWFTAGASLSLIPLAKAATAAAATGAAVGGTVEVIGNTLTGNASFEERLDALRQAERLRGT